MIKWKANSLSVWVNILHVIAVAPLLIYIGSKGYDTPRWAFEVLAMLGFAALGYHLYSMVNEIKDISMFDHKVTQKVREEASLEVK